MFYTKDSPELVDLNEQELKNLLGGKGAGLYGMAKAGLPVPPFVVIPTSIWAMYSGSPSLVREQLTMILPDIEQYLRGQLGLMPGEPNPLLSVRSGARVSCPGMMDTILNVGLDQESFPLWVERLGNACAFDSYRRLVKMYAGVVKGIEISGESQTAMLAEYQRKAGEGFPDAQRQLLDSIEAVFKSWNNDRAKVYRKMHSIPENWGTAVVIQVMVFGNLDAQSGTGVLFTRNPDSGENSVVGEFLINAQGEDVVDGSHTPMPLSKMEQWNKPLAEQLLSIAQALELSKRAVQDIEFTIQAGKLWILQTRNAKLSSRANVRVALDLLNEGLIDRDEAKNRVSTRDLDLSEQASISPAFTDEPNYTGIPACSGVVVGVVARTIEDVMDLKAKGKQVVLVRKETTPDDIGAMQVADAVLTMAGGATSHAAVVARGMNRPCVVGLGASLVSFKVGKVVSIDGQTGRVWTKAVPLVKGENKAAEEFRSMLMGSGSLLVNRAPKFKVPSLTIDLRELLLATLTEIEGHVLACAIKCANLNLLLPDSLTPEQAHRIGVFFNGKALNTVIGRVRTFVEDLKYPETVKVKAFGWKSTVFEYRSVVTGESIEALVMLDRSALLEGPMEGPVVEKIRGWLAKDGIELEVLGQPGGVATWEEHAGA